MTIEVPASTSDVLLLGVVLAIFVVLARLAFIKVQRFSPGEKAPWEGRYVSTFRASAEARMHEGTTLPPPQPASSEGAKWRLKDSQSTTRWIFIAFLLGVLAVLCYGQVDTAVGPQGPAATPTGAGTLVVPAPHRGPARAIRPHLVTHARRARWPVAGGAARAPATWRGRRPRRTVQR
jgi:hypothetical protein